METGDISAHLDRGAASRDTRLPRPFVWPDPRDLDPRTDRWLKDIFVLLLRRKQVDFSLYRKSSILRAVASRMNVLEIQNPSEYVRRLSGDPAELERLYERILIKTTAFFRDPEAFDYLQNHVLGPLVKRRSLAPIRVWVVGCSTGEEAYSVAMSLVECSERTGKRASFQILATDVSETALRQARAGEYTHRMLRGVSPERLHRFFTKTVGGYRVRRELRGACLFSRHNLVQSIPFSRMDLVTCRNVLIYMEPELQRRALDKLHFALKPGGVLMLGTSESIPLSWDWKSVESRHRIFRRL